MRKWKLDALPTAYVGSGDAAYGGLDFKKEPLVARVAASGQVLIVVDRGTHPSDECSLGILVPTHPVTSARQLGTLARSLCKSINGRWGSRRLKDLPEPEFRVFAVKRAAKMWQEPEAYAGMLARRLASALDS